jgi:8-amino-7-oxononanoate synthase
MSSKLGGIVMMSGVARSLRQKRFLVKDSAPIKVVVDTRTGARFEFHLYNCSISGIAVITEQIPTVEDGFGAGDIVPAAKIYWENHEYALGRLVYRGTHKQGNSQLLGFSTIDSKVPVDGPLSRFLETSTENTFYEYELNPDKFNLATFRESKQSNVDLFSKAHQFKIFHTEWKKTNRYSYDSVRLPSKGPRVQLTRKRPNNRNDYIIMGSNDYLGLAAHPDVIQAAKQSIDDYGFGSTGSPVTTGICQIHEELSNKLSKMLKKEKVLLFNSGYAANVGTITGLLNEQDLVVADMLAHASIQDGILMSNATGRYYKHNSTQHLQKILRNERENHVGALLITEGVFSMDGDTPKLNEFVATAKNFNARTFVDEAHSFGVVGTNGLGACEKYGVLDDVDIVMGTFSKICGGIGGFIATTEEVADWLHFFARAHMFSISIPPAAAAVALKALEIFTSQPQLLINLRQNIKHFVDGLISLGFPLDPNHESAVVPVTIGDERKMGVMNEVLWDSGVYVIPITYPAVSRNNCRFRFTVTAGHTISDLDFVLNVVEKSMLKAKFEPNNEELTTPANVA